MRARVWVSDTPKRLKGTPSWLLKLSFEAKVLKERLVRAAKISFTVVFKLDPAMATTFAFFLHPVRHGNFLEGHKGVVDF